MLLIHLYIILLGGKMVSVHICILANAKHHLKWYWAKDGYGVKTNNIDELEALYFDKQRIDHDQINIINNRLEYIINEYDARFSFVISGTYLDECDDTIIDSFDKLFSKDGVELLGTTYHTSIASMFSDAEFKEQILLHQSIMHDIFNVKPKVFMNADLICTNHINSIISECGYSAVITEGSNIILEGWRSPNYIYQQKSRDMPMLLRHMGLGNDVLYHYFDTNWDKYPLMAGDFMSWIQRTDGDVITLVIDYDSMMNPDFLEFITYLSRHICETDDTMTTASEALSNPEFEPMGLMDIPHYNAICLNNMARLLGNHQQHIYLNKLASLEDMATASDWGEEIWRQFQSTIHFDAMDSTGFKGWNPYEKAVNAMSILSDFERRLMQ